MKFRTLVAVTCIAGVGGYLAYNNLLNEDQRAEVTTRFQKAQVTIQRVGQRLKPVIEDMASKAKQPENYDHSNQERTRRQWEALGF